MPQRKILLQLILIAAFVLILGAPAFAQEDVSEPTPPPTRAELEGLKKKNIDEDDEDAGLPFDIRNDALKEAALSYGARGGLAWRTFNIRKELEDRATYLDKVFDFRQLLISAPSGLLIEPPIITEEENALLISDGGQEAAVADRIYNISANAKIVSAPRHWRNYLERDWGKVDPPPDILLPENDEERKAWVEGIQEGWEEGLQQADEIFEDDLNQLTAHYQGMVRYRMLLSQSQISAPFALQIDRGVTGGGEEMRIGDRAVQITGRPYFKSGAQEWQPANR